MVVEAIIKSGGLKSNRGGCFAKGDELPSLLLLYQSSSEDTLPSTSARSSTCRHANFNFQVRCMARHDLGTQRRVEQSRFERTQARRRLTGSGRRRLIQADPESHLGVRGDNRSNDVVDQGYYL